ncbi:hypothetical protein PQX77_003461, partial [Marasmius sp. AFHP31]
DANSPSPAGNGQRKSGSEKVLRVLRNNAELDVNKDSRAGDGTMFGSGHDAPHGPPRQVYKPSTVQRVPNLSFSPPTTISLVFSPVSSSTQPGPITQHAYPSPTVPPSSSQRTSGIGPAVPRRPPT